MLGVYLGQLEVKRRDVHLPQPPEHLERHSGGGTREELDDGEVAEVVRGDEELQQNVQRTGEHPVRHGHGNSDPAAFEHIHGGPWSSEATQPKKTRSKSVFAVKK